MKKLIAGNWKMNGTTASADALADSIVKAIQSNPQLTETCDFVVCPPALHITTVRKAVEKSPVAVGGQDCSQRDNGAVTGDISAEMLADAGCTYVILGHSERRQFHDESDSLISAKAAAAHAKGLTAIICVGETEQERERGQQEAVVGAQLNGAIPRSATAANTVIAYEPVWAIGTGKSATPDDIAAMHGFIRERLKERLADSAQIRILYGGSVKPENAASIFTIDNVDGALIGGASLKSEQYIGIASCVAGDKR